MKLSNILLGKDVTVDPSSSLNNIKVGNNVKVAKYCSLYGNVDNLMEIGDNSYVGMFCLLNGFAAAVKIGKNVSIAQYVNIMAESGPNASAEMQAFFPIIKGPVTIGDHCWIGANAIIMPNVTLGDFCVVAANSFVNKSFPAYSVVGGNPAKFIKKLGQNS